MAPDTSIPPGHLSTLREKLVQHFNLEELQTLSHDLGVRYENLAGETLNAKALALTEHLDRRGRIPELVEMLVPPWTVEKFADALDQAGVTVDMALIEGAGHGFIVEKLTSPEMTQSLAAIEPFLAALLVE